ncbi:hypothetical protein DFA_02815 [Cavenderia fasciculata]|uniref:AAA domain-containing protein n=1 Tax=Cavenderia fasciculata TaxID=261658 RepID=F4PIJ2_CACFS|nr:uncharacterized protein DFA_02815 [Cavenderia fasciculata]EGG24572.1 hypothetical protein DFA_02815 [Cavenderia fasciculata]|eukprot:XP_004362423.1 hypothetical protein DFA_02815 [Cavenderia fasciculata]
MPVLELSFQQKIGDLLGVPNSTRSVVPPPPVRPTRMSTFEPLLRWYLDCGAIVILDEFQILPGHFFDGLRSVLDVGPFKGAIVLVGSHVTQIGAELNPIHGRFFETIWFKPLSATKSFKLVKQINPQISKEQFLTIYAALDGVIGYYDTFIEVSQNIKYKPRLSKLFNSATQYVNELSDFQVSLLRAIWKLNGKNIITTFSKETDCLSATVEKHIDDLINCKLVVDKKCYFSNNPNRLFVIDNPFRASLESTLEKYTVLEGFVLEEIARSHFKQYIARSTGRDVEVDDRHWASINAEIDVMASSGDGHYYWGSCKRSSTKQIHPMIQTKLWRMQRPFQHKQYRRSAFPCSHRAIQRGSLSNSQLTLDLVSHWTLRHCYSHPFSHHDQTILFTFRRSTIDLYFYSS